MARGRQRKDWEIAQWLSWNTHAWGMKQSTMPLEFFNPWRQQERQMEDGEEVLPYARPPGSVRITASTISQARNLPALLNSVHSSIRLLSTTSLVAEFEITVIDQTKNFERAYWKAERKQMNLWGGVLRKRMRQSIRRRNAGGPPSKMVKEAFQELDRAKRVKLLRRAAKKIRRQTSTVNDPARAHLQGGRGLKYIKYDYKKKKPLIVGPLKYDAVGHQVPKTLEDSGGQSAEFYHLRVMENYDPDRPGPIKTHRRLHIGKRPTAALTLANYLGQIQKDIRRFGQLIQTFSASPHAAAGYLVRQSSRPAKSYIKIP
jgi:hypothetical protein